MKSSRFCPKCQQEKPISYFYKNSKTGKFRSSCKDCWNKYQRERYAASPEETKLRTAEYYQEHKTHMRETQKSWRKAHPNQVRAYNKKYYSKTKRTEEIREKANEYARQRYQNRPIIPYQEKLSGMLRRIWLAKGEVRVTKLNRLLGCSPKAFYNHLLQTWEYRYGTPYNGEPCHIDHIIPLATSSTKEDVDRLTHYTNLQLLTPEDNRLKFTKTEF